MHGSIFQSDLTCSLDLSPLKAPEKFFASNIFNDLQKYAQQKINDLQTFPEFSVSLNNSELRGWSSAIPQPG
ncbi:MAG: hypothetical protein DRR19_23435 [Candidatus Parabeggiatoa sp. nov. 1]|nr:MAG: hypothetical protein DRR19_23435 [Gammaproteobacteria bacterium]